MRHITSHLVKTLDIGANQNLFGGRMLEWLDETGVIYTKQIYPGSFVTIKVGEVIFHHPIKEQSVIDFYVDELTAGKSSLNFKVIVKSRDTQVVSAEITFVHIGPDNRKQYLDWFELETESFKEAVYNRIKKYYSDDTRKYHNIFHINNMIALLNHAHAEKLIKDQADFKELYLAIAYHDAVYAPGSADNEEASIRLLMADFEHCRNESFRKHLDHVCALIRSTKVGFPPEEIRSIPNADLLHDFDYMVFADYKKMLEYDRQIGVEYLGESPEAEYNEQFKTQRRNFLAGLLERPIFLSPHFAKLNGKARENLRELLNEQH